MAKEFLLSKVIKSFLSSDRLYKFSRFARGYSGEYLNVVSTDEAGCYTNQDWYGNKRIVLGNQFYSEIFNLPDTVSYLDLKSRYKHMAQCYVAVFYHEFFHVLYTDMSYAKSMYDRMDKNFVNFAHSIVNILEDITIEGTGKKFYPYSNEYLDVLNEVHTRKEVLDKVAEEIKNNPDNPGTLLSFLLLLVRGYDVSLLPCYELYEKNKDFIKWGSFKCINSINARQRFNRQINFAKQLINILDLKTPDRTLIDEGTPGDYTDYDGPSKAISQTAKDILKPTELLSNYNKSNSRFENKPQDTLDDLVDEDLKEPTKQFQASRDDHQETNDGHSGFDNTDLTKEAITTIANDDPVTRYTHIASRIDEFKNTTGYLSQYKTVVNRNEKQIRKVVAQIRKMKALNNTSWNKYKMTGKFDLSTIYKKDNYKFFKTKNAPSTEADLVFEILVDNSGSMSGKKSKLAGEALIIFAEALNRLHIPFAVDAFTEGSSCVTIKLKEFNDSYNKVKTNMTLLTEQYDVRELATFSGNIDEVNLMYVRDILNQQRQKDKVCIVISDGATCGSWKDLRKVAQSMEAQGITVLGIGVYDENVKDIYTNHLILKTQQDLEGLGAFLNKYLVRKIFK